MEAGGWENEMPTQHIGLSALCESGSAYSMAECHERTQDQPAGLASPHFFPLPRLLLSQKSTTGASC